MAKRQKISDKIQAKFDKPQFRIGDAVFFSWLGQKQYGHVIRIKKASWGIQYSVESYTGTKYPCGIQIQGQKTHYNTGYILHDDTRTIGTKELERRIQTFKKQPGYTEVSVNATRQKTESRNDNKNGRSINTNSNSKNTTTSKRRSSTKSNVSSGIDGIGNNNTKKRTATKKSKLDDAVQRQRDFLNGFINRD